jgi:hypothetical protein
VKLKEIAPDMNPRTIHPVGHLWRTVALGLLAVAGTTPVGATLVVYPNTPNFQSDGKVTGTLNGQSVTFEYQHTYHPDSKGPKEFKASYVRFAADAPVNVQMTVGATINAAFLRTVGKDLSFTRNGSSFEFTLPGPGTYYLQLPDLNTAGITYTVFFFFDDLEAYSAYQQAFLSARNVLNNGVVSHPTLDQTGAVQNVLNGHGAIYFPAGTFRTGQLTIGSNTTIYLAPGALLKGTDSYNTDQYLYTNGAQNVRIAGLGVIDANGLTSGNMATSSHLYNAEAITNLSISDVIVRNSNSWSLHVRRCDQVSLVNVKVFSGKDGIDPDGTRDMTVRRAVIQSVDDGFAVKSKFSGRSCERVTMRDCIVFSCASSLKIGTENYEGTVRDVTWDGCDAVDADRGCILYTNKDEGDAPISNITWRNIRIFNYPSWYGETGGAPFQFHNLYGASVSNLLLENIVATPTEICTTYGTVSATFRNVIVNGASSIPSTGMTFQGVIWPGVVSLNCPVVFIAPSARNQNEYCNGDEVTVTVQHPYGEATSRVDLFADQQPAGTRTTAPYRFTLAGLSRGEHVLTASATDVAGGVNTTAPGRIQIIQNTAPTLVSNSLSATTLIADNATTYTVTLTGNDIDGVSDLVDMRILLDDGIYASEHARGNLAWGASDVDIAYYGGQWTFMGDAAGGGRWAWRLNEWGSDTYITPLSAATSVAGNQRSVTFTLAVKRAWAPAVSQRLRGFARDIAGADTTWILPPGLYDVIGFAPGDFDRDGDVDQVDFGRFQSCYVGPGVEQTQPACMEARLDADVDVDLDDFAVFQACMSGPRVAADLRCDR